MIRSCPWVVLLVLRVFAAEPDPRMVAPRDAVRDKLPSTPPVAPSEAVKTFRVLDGFHMELLAAEPLVASPVAIAYDENGRAYVCEMRDYPYTDKARHQRNQENPTDAAIGTVRLLEDTDGDGVFDKSTVFAQGLSWPTGVACWKGGVFVAATPEIWYFKDTDGDGKADVRRKVFTGFRKFNVQSVMNTLVWGLDNRIYGSGSSNGGEIRPAGKPDAKPIVMGRNDFRFDPLTEEFELLSGGARFGGTFDDWGHRFLCDIRNPAQQVMIPQRYLARNPFLAVGSPLNDMAEFGDQLPVYRISEPEPWRVLRAKRWAGERDILMPRSELVGAGVVTSSSGITCYRGAAYPDKYYGNVFVCECAGNLFYRLELTPDGPTFKAKRVDAKAEIVASTDTWFRPVNFVNAPDGTLHVVDMYRENIEHPWSIPDDIHAAVDLESGRDRGRIWRLTPPNFKPPKPPHLGSATTAELVTALENPNAWWRETAQRLLFERQDMSVAAPLHDMVRTGRRPQARLQALWTLAGFNRLAEKDLLAGLADDSAGVRENAVKLAETRSVSTQVREELFKRATDPDPFVRFQLAFTLGEISDLKSIEALAVLAAQDGLNYWIRAAILSSAAKTGSELLNVIVRRMGSWVANGAEKAITFELAKMLGAQMQVPAMERALSSAMPVASGSGSVIYSEVFSGIGDGLNRSGRSYRDIRWSAEVLKSIDRTLRSASQDATNNQLSEVFRRIPAIHNLTFDRFEEVKTTLANLLGTEEPDEIQKATVAALGSFNEVEVAGVLLGKWQTATPPIRSEIVTAMLNSRNRVLPLLQAIDDGLIPPHQVPFPRRATLLRSSDPRVQELAKKIYGDMASAPRKEVIAKYQSALSLVGDSARGKKVFETTCATCHRAEEIGKDVGPNLATIRQWNPEQMLINILDPNREVAANFLSYTVETQDGRTIDGVIAQENAASLTLKRADGSSETVLRRDIQQISGSGLSLMPEGLENSVTVEQMADLIAFLKASL